MNRPIALHVQSSQVRQAYVTLDAGCRFMAGRAADAAMDVSQLGEFAHARLLGNRFRELDRFLTILIDEIAATHLSLRQERKAFRRQYNVARKLGQVEQMAGQPLAFGDHARLRAIGQVANVFHHCAGKVHDIGVIDALGVAHGAGVCVVNRVERGGHLRIGPVTIMMICDFYRGIGDRLLPLESPENGSLRGLS